MKPSRNEIKKRDCEYQIRITSRDFKICILHNTIQRSQYCIGVIGIAAHHIIKRKNYNARWENINGATLCLNCHTWAELNPKKSEKLIINIFISRNIISSWAAWRKFKMKCVKY